jgi:hypothetical protein
VISVLVIGHKISRLNTSEDDGFLRAIKIRSTNSFGGEVKKSALCHKVSRHVKGFY